MARKKFEEGFKENAIEYCKTHSEKTIKACAAELGIGYSTLRRWIAQSEEQATVVAEAKEAEQEGAEADDDVTEAIEPIAEDNEKEEVSATIESAVTEPEDAESAPAEGSDVPAEVDIEDEHVVEEIVEDVDDEIADKREGVKSQLGELIETAGSGMSEAVQLIGLYKKRHELKKVQRKLQKEKEKRLKK